MYKYKVFAIDGRDQQKGDGDFHITPVLSCSYASGDVWGWKFTLALEWGFWATGIFIGKYKTRIKK